MSAVEQAAETFRRLIAMTPQPDSSQGASALLEQGLAMLEERETEFAILRVLLDGNPELLRGNDECRAMRDELSLRTRQWESALEWARGELAKHRLASQRARQAQRAYRVPGTGVRS